MNKAQKKKFLSLLVHIAVWTLVSGLPFMLIWRSHESDFWSKFLHHCVFVVALSAIYYLNYFIVIDKLMFRKRMWEFLLVNFILAIVMGQFVHLWDVVNVMQFDNEPRSAHHNDFPLALSYFFKYFMPYVIPIGVCIAVKTTRKWHSLDAEIQEGEKKRIEAELTNLRQQLNPHFLFNTLNNIYALIAISPDRAQQTVLDLSKLLRYALYENNQNFVPLQLEIDFIKNYVELMRIRLTNDIDLQTDINIATDMHKTVAPMLFISLVENSFKHGISVTYPSFIHISIRENGNDELVCTIKNSCFPKDASDTSGSGIGLENLRRRLQLLYPHQHTLLTEKEGNTFVAQLIIPLLNA